MPCSAFRLRRGDCGVAGGGVRVVSEEGRGMGAVPPGKIFLFFPKTMGFYKICLFVLFIGNPTGRLPNYRESRLQRSYSERQKKKNYTN